MIIFLIIAAITFLLLEHTSWGLSVYMVGCNPTAARFSGINVKKVMMKVYIYSGFLGSVATIIMMSRYNSARIDYGSSLSDADGDGGSCARGTVITGGYGKVIGVVLSVLVLQCISSGLNIAGLDTNLSTVITGLLLISVLARELHKRVFSQRRKSWLKTD